MTTAYTCGAYAACDVFARLCTSRFCTLLQRFQPILPALDSKSEPPALFDGTSRLYISVFNPFAQRVWIARNFKGLDKIKIVQIDLRDKPTWYVEKVYPVGKVPSLEHNGKVIGVSLDLLEYIEKNFGGPSIFPKGMTKEAATKELLEYSDEMNKQGFTILRNNVATTSTAEETLDPIFDHLEATLAKFSAEGPYFLGAISAVLLIFVLYFSSYCWNHR